MLLFLPSFKVLQKPLNKTSLEPKIISPDLSRVAVLVLRHQVWSNDSGDGGLVGGVQDVGEDGAKIIDFTAADHTESLACRGTEETAGPGGGTKSHEIQNGCDVMVMLQASCWKKDILSRLQHSKV